LSGFDDAWNFGPLPTDVRTVGELADAFLARSGRPGWQLADTADAPREAGLLRLAIDKTVAGLGWQPRWDFAQTVSRTAEWYRATADGTPAREACLADLAAYRAAVGTPT